MPWTLVHPAAVLPLRRSVFARLPFDALVIGSMSPDLGYYVGAFHFAARAHTAAGILASCLPVGLVLCLLIRPLYAPVTALLPAPHRQVLGALKPRPLYSVQGLLLGALALLLGAATHNVWDSFTHLNGTGVALLPVLRRNVASLGGHVFSACELLQHASTVLGAVLLLHAYRGWLRAHTAESPVRSEPQDALRWALLAVLLAVSLLAAASWQATALSERYGHWGWMGDLVRFVIISTSVFAVLVTAVALGRRVAHGPGGEA